jgi:DNA-binding beta-propeller fold protein YncE
LKSVITILYLLFSLTTLNIVPHFIDDANGQGFDTLNVGPGKMAVNPLTNTIYVTVEDSVYVIDGETNKIVSSITLGEQFMSDAIAVNTHTNMVYVSNWNPTLSRHVISVIDGSTNEIFDTILTGSATYDIAVNSEMDRIYFISSDPNRINVYDRSLNEVVETIDVGDANNLVVNPNSDLLYASYYDYASHTFDLAVIDGSTNILVDTIEGGGGEWITINPDRNLIYSLNNTGIVSVIDALSKIKLDTIHAGNEEPGFFTSRGIAVNPIANMIYVTDVSQEIQLAPHTVLVIDGSTKKVVDTITVTGEILGISINPTTNLVYVTSLIDIKFPCYECTREYLITVIDGSTNRVVDTVQIEHIPYRAYTIQIDDKAIPIRYKITSGELKGMFIDLPAHAIMVVIDSPTNGQLRIELSRNIIDSKQNGMDKSYFVAIGPYATSSGVKPVEFNEVETTEEKRILLIGYPEGTSLIEIAGTYIIPEFPISLLVVSVAIGLTVIMLRLRTVRLHSLP